MSQPIQRITVSSPVEEIVQKVMVDEGDQVKAGQVLAELLSTQERLEVQRLDALIVKAESDYQAIANLVKEEIESKEKLTEAETALKSLKLEREIALAQLEERIIRSPISGTVVFRLKDPGEAIGRVEPLFEVINPAQLKLQFFMTAAELPVLQEGLEAEVKFPSLKGEEGFAAGLDFVDPQIDSRSGMFRVRFLFDNTEAAILPGARVQVKLPEAN
ncbi:efflux RND transporter periplasmic adaptor subunit [Coraliomargarita akajimensis]|nr:efflux RND transporter periplasmic adaptor subunit [Coraliomargarita akajimensis]